MQSCRLFFLGAAALTALAIAPLAFADGDSYGRAPRAARTPNRASDASFDKRLPPVLPGEEVRRGHRLEEGLVVGACAPGVGGKEATAAAAEPRRFRGFDRVGETLGAGGASRGGLGGAEEEILEGEGACRRGRGEELLLVGVEGALAQLFADGEEGECYAFWTVGNFSASAL